MNAKGINEQDKREKDRREQKRKAREEARKKIFSQKIITDCLYNALSSSRGELNEELMNNINQQIKDQCIFTSIKSA